MVSDLLKLVLLEECYGCCISRTRAKELFGDKVISNFLKKYPDYAKDEHFIGSISCRETKQRRRLSKEKLDKARESLTRLKYIPWIVFAGVTGSTGYMTAEANDDIDVFIVAKRNRLWLTRLFCWLLFSFSHMRRKFADVDVKDKFCFNFYISRDKLKFRERNFYIALELVNTIGIVNENFINTIWAENLWILKYFPGLKKTIVQNKPSGARPSAFSCWMDVLDFAAMKVQIAYMVLMNHPYKKHKLTRDFIKFYESDKWKQRKIMLDNRLAEIKAR